MNRAIIGSVKRQARRYGEQIRLLEDAGLYQDRAQVRWAWTAFRRQLGRGYLFDIAYRSYTEAYCQ